MLQFQLFFYSYLLKGFDDSIDQKYLVQIKHLFKSTFKNLRATASQNNNKFFSDNILKLKYYYYADYFKIIRFFFRSNKIF